MRRPSIRATRAVRLATVIAMLMAAAGAAVAQIPLRSVDELFHEADLVFVGDCDQVRSFWDPPKTMIFTEVGHQAVDPTLVFKGAVPAGGHRFVRPGGKVDNLHTVVSHQPVYRPYQRSLLFLYAPERVRIYGTVGAAAGQIPVRVDPETEAEYVELWSGPGGRLYPAAADRGAQRVRLSLPELSKRMRAIANTEELY